jgi:cephalosporin-C deacetylase-like acetyl esterase
VGQAFSLPDFCYGLIVLLAILVPITQVCAQNPVNDDPLLRWMDKIAQKELDARDAEIAKIKTVADAEKRKKFAREKMLLTLGGLPEYDGPLNAKVTGSIQADGFVIEKVIYESLPGYFVTANVYRPSRPGRYPGVLFQAGHTQEGKSEPQLLAANLALKGFVSLSFDPVGQGEREQTYDPQLKAPAAGWSVMEHVHAEAQGNLIGEGVARYFIWDAKRSLDYLVSRPDVDPARVGAAGCSGGGALTAFIGALDTRLKAVIPACFPNSYHLLFTGAAPGSEMSFPDSIAQGLDTADFVELTAPTPWLIQATEHDYFTPPGAKMVYDEAKRWFALYGAEDKIGMFVGPGGHGTPLVSREAVYKWMIRWLKDGQGDYREQPAKLYNNRELLVTPTGRVEDLPGSRKLYQLILEDYKAKKHKGSTTELLAKLRSLKIPSDSPAPSVEILRESNGDGFRIQEIRFESEPGVAVEGKLYLPASPGRKPAVLLVPGKLSEWLKERLAKSGRVVLELEPRRSFSFEPRRPFAGDYIANERATLIGLNLPALRAHDIVRGVDLLAARDDVDTGSIRAAAQGVRGIWLLLAAASDPRISKVWLDRTPYTLVEALHNTLNVELSDAVIPGFLLHWDLDDLTKAMGERKILWTDPTNWMARVVSPGPPFRNRYVLGDLTDWSDAQDEAYTKEFLQ